MPRTIPTTTKRWPRIALGVAAFFALELALLFYGATIYDVVAGWMQ